jgi:hypothetical protein
MPGLGLTNTITLLIGDREPAFVYEREIRLFEFQTWIYFPGSRRDQRAARLLAGARFLEQIQQEKLHTDTLYARRLRQLLKQGNDYQKLYDKIFASSGGLTQLRNTRLAHDFDEGVRIRKWEAYDVCEIIDYRFRHLDHGGDASKGTITYGQVYRTKEPGKAISYKTLKRRWSQNRASAEFLYVSEKLGVSLRPPALRRKAFVDRISAQAANKEYLQRFFGQCAYVIKILHGQKAEQHQPQVPASIKPIQPSTSPLGPEEIARVSNYKEESRRMKNE